ncbi:MAG: hypothetical protein LBK41_05750 [Clostridiales bacterium]|nr:hypothetical protein [Clostridiales bacterium]
MRNQAKFTIKPRIEEYSRGRHLLQKFLEGANVTLGGWAPDPEGKSATEQLELAIGKPDFTLDDASARTRGI